ncbi:hypothetical protein C7M84_019851 [Penaeus vannamei]|uniref:Uncharacterized protein n=1 Tax=Penaeus vannamei TaxID=6689 RepID=A0A423SDN2_PENVA|nr:hypothetical protein C7M84_019851 [Penaeus vannamei]
MGSLLCLGSIAPTSGVWFSALGAYWGSVYLPLPLLPFFIRVYSFFFLFCSSLLSLLLLFSLFFCTTPLFYSSLPSISSKSLLPFPFFSFSSPLFFFPSPSHLLLSSFVPLSTNIFVFVSLSSYPSSCAFLSLSSSLFIFFLIIFHSYLPVPIFTIFHHGTNMSFTASYPVLISPTPRPLTYPPSPHFPHNLTFHLSPSHFPHSPPSPTPRPLTYLPILFPLLDLSPIPPYFPLQSPTPLPLAYHPIFHLSPPYLPPNLTFHLSPSTFPIVPQLTLSPIPPSPTFPQSTAPNSPTFNLFPHSLTFHLSPLHFPHRSQLTLSPIPSLSLSFPYPTIPHPHFPTVHRPQLPPFSLFPTAYLSLIPLQFPYRPQLNLSPIPQSPTFPTVHRRHLSSICCSLPRSNCLLALSSLQPPSSSLKHYTSTFHLFLPFFTTPSSLTKYFPPSPSISTLPSSSFPLQRLISLTPFPSLLSFPLLNALFPFSPSPSSLSSTPYFPPLLAPLRSPLQPLISPHSSLPLSLSLPSSTPYFPTPPTLSSPLQGLISPHSLFPPPLLFNALFPSTPPTPPPSLSSPFLNTLYPYYTTPSSAT